MRYHITPTTNDNIMDNNTNLVDAFIAGLDINISKIIIRNIRHKVL